MYLEDRVHALEVMLGLTMRDQMDRAPGYFAALRTALEHARDGTTPENLALKIALDPKVASRCLELLGE